MRWIATCVAVYLGTACTSDPPGLELPAPIETVWGRTIHPGALVVLVPGTGAYDYLAASIEPLGGTDPLVDVHAIPLVADDADVFEQALAAARRAGITPDQLAAGAVTFGLWGAGFTRLEMFDYVSYDGIQIRVNILGGENTCAVGHVIDNVFNYGRTNAASDASDLYLRVQTWLAAHPASEVVFASHSWGGAVAEYLAFEQPTLEAAAGAWPGGAKRTFTISAGVPAFIPGYTFMGPGLRDLPEGSLYEIDRPDDPVHALNLDGNSWGHQYDILIGDAFVGAYGVSTTELACEGVAGACH